MDPPRPIFIHGAGGGSASWQHQEPRFEGCMVLALPGHPAGSAMGSVGGYAEWVAAAVRDLPGPRVLVGHSMGAAIALQVGLDHPELVAGIVMVASGARLFVPETAFELARADFPAECERLIRKGWPEIDADTLAAEVAAMEEHGQDTLIQDYTACLNFDVRERLSEVAVPVLVVAGDRDELTPPTLAEELGRGLRQSIVAVVPGSGHWVMKQHPGAVDLLLAGFLARLELTTDG